MKARFQIGFIFFCAISIVRSHAHECVPATNQLALALTSTEPSPAVTTEISNEQARAALNRGYSAWSTLPEVRAYDVVVQPNGFTEKTFATIKKLPKREIRYAQAPPSEATIHAYAREIIPQTMAIIATDDFWNPQQLQGLGQHTNNTHVQIRVGNDWFHLWQNGIEYGPYDKELLRLSREPRQLAAYELVFPLSSQAQQALLTYYQDQIPSIAPSSFSNGTHWFETVQYAEANWGEKRPNGTTIHNCISFAHGWVRPSAVLAYRQNRGVDLDWVRQETNMQELLPDRLKSERGSEELITKTDVASFVFQAKEGALIVWDPRSMMAHLGPDGKPVIRNGNEVLRDPIYHILAFATRTSLKSVMKRLEPKNIQATLKKFE